MAVHSFASIAEIQEAKTDEERERVRAKVLEESRAFDTYLREAVQNHNAEERKKALLDLESLYEFKRSHPTVEVRHTLPPFPIFDILLRRPALTEISDIIALHPTSSNSWRSRRCEGCALRSRHCRAWNVVSKSTL